MVAFGNPAAKNWGHRHSKMATKKPCCLEELEFQYISIAILICHVAYLHTKNPNFGIFFTFWYGGIWQPCCRGEP
jgi:hypothetical protein